MKKQINQYWQNIFISKLKGHILEVVISYFGGGGIKVDILVASGVISDRITSEYNKEQPMAEI